MRVETIMLTETLGTAVTKLRHILKTSHVVSYLIAPIETLDGAAALSGAAQIMLAHDGCIELAVCANTEEQNENAEVADKLFCILYNVWPVIRAYEAGVV